jgi:hypothetical protein
MKTLWRRDAGVPWIVGRLSRVFCIMTSATVLYQDICNEGKVALSGGKPIDALEAEQCHGRTNSIRGAS